MLQDYKIVRRVALVTTDVSEEPSASFIRETRIGEAPPKDRFLQQQHGVTSQKTPFFIVTAVKTSNLTCRGIVLESRRDEVTGG
jgi:hypothetical protein